MSDSGGSGTDFNGKGKCHIYHTDRVGVDAQLLCEILQSSHV